MRLLLTLFIVAAAPFYPQEPTQNASVTGTIFDGQSEVPLPGLTVSATTVVSATSKEVSTQTDAQGRYRLANLAPGNYFLTVKGLEISSSSSRDVRVIDGQEVTADFALEIAARVSGRVTDWEKKPIAKASVVLLEELYQKAVPVYRVALSAQTDENGRYDIEMVKPARRYVVMAKPFMAPSQSGPEVPSDAVPEHRQPAPTVTFFPGAESPEGAQAIEVRSGQKMEDVDIQLKPDRPWCVSGSFEPRMAPPASRFEIVGSVPGVSTVRLDLLLNGTRDGRFHLCGLTRGEYTAIENPASKNERRGNFNVIDKDLTDLKVVSIASIDVPVELICDHDDFGNADTLAKGMRLVFGNRVVNFGRSRLTMRDVPVGVYPVDVLGLGAAWYVKQMQFIGEDVLHRFAHVGSAVGDLRIVLAHDSGSFTALVTDGGGRPLPSESVWVMPANVGSAPDMEEVLTSGTTDSHGLWSAMLPPGKYRVLATRARFQHTASQMDRLWGVRLRGTEVEVLARGKNDVRLELTPMN
jgi:hypothetical protein